MADRRKGGGRRGAARSQQSVAVFALYGETAPVADQEFVHIEDITSRNLLYNWDIRTHRHQGLFQMVSLLNGRASLSLEDQTHELDGPCAVILPAGVVHGFHFTPGAFGYVLTLAESLLQRQEGGGRLLAECLLWEPMVMRLADGGARLAALLDQLHQEFRGEAAARPAMLEWLVGAVLILAARERAQAAGAAQTHHGQADMFSRFRAEVEAHFLQHWSVPDYAAALGLTESKLNRVCRAAAGRPTTSCRRGCCWRRSASCCTCRCRWR